MHIIQATCLCLSIIGVLPVIVLCAGVAGCLMHVFALQPRKMLMYGLLKSMPYALYSGYLFVCRFAEYLTDKVPHRLLQTSVPANVYCMLIRTLAQEAVPSDRAKACESLCGGKPSLLAPTLGNSAPWLVYGIYSVKITAC